MPFSWQAPRSVSQERLIQLIEARSQADAPRAELEKRIWELFGENWAVMWTDLSGFSRQVEAFGIVHFLQTIHTSHRLFLPLIEAQNGLLLKVEGDSLLVLFKQAEQALLAAISMQECLLQHNQGLASEDQVLLCVGLGYGPLLKIGDADAFGEELNAASKLGEDTAQAGEILVTRAFQQQVQNGYAFSALTAAPAWAAGAWRLDWQDA
ncbi:MAG: adenylate/guanylate cyclase domain-containing protein [Candidatus Sericytochromatia bacterium]